MAPWTCPLAADRGYHSWQRGQLSGRTADQCGEPPSGV